MTPLCTAGYEGRTADDLIALLIANDIRVVVDVRERPLSRKRGLSKGALSQRLADEGLEYVHVRALGNPKEYRDALKSGWDFDEFAAEFMRLLAEQGDALADLANVVVSKRTCLLCFEANPAECHRSLVADALAGATDIELEVVHLGYSC